MKNLPPKFYLKINNWLPFLRVNDGNCQASIIFYGFDKILVSLIISWIVNSSVSIFGVSCSVNFVFAKKWCSLSLVCFIQSLQLSLCYWKCTISVAATSLWLFFLTISSLLLQLSHMYLGWTAVTSSSMSYWKVLRFLYCNCLSLLHTFDLTQLLFSKVNIYHPSQMFKLNNRNNKNRRRSGVFSVNFEHVSHFFLVIL